LEEETPEQRESRLKDQREKRALKKKEREEKEAQNPGEKKEKPEKKKAEIPEDVEPAYDQVLLPSQKRASSKMNYYECPIPHDRHLYALERCQLNENLSNVLLKNEVDEDTVFLIQGPPGTGKTSELLKRVQDVDATKRVLLCATTNVGAADLYTRCVRMGLANECSLILPPDRIPKDTVLMSESPKQRIVCCTVSGRNGRFLENEEFEYVFLDEAGQCMEAYTWGLLRNSVEFFCMAGDIYQLPSQTSESGKVLKHDRSLMQRLLDNKYPCQSLTKQRRMHPEISQFPNHYFYEGKLQDSVSRDVNNPIAFINVKGMVTEDKTSFCNKKEADVCIQCATQLLEEYSNVVIMSPYSAQCKLLLSQSSGIPVHTVDSFQGKEADAVVLSMVRDGSNMGFWSDPRRLTVALTRAKFKLVIVGYGSSWTHAPLKDLYKDAVSRKYLVVTK